MPKFKLVSEHLNADFEVEFRTTSEFEVELLEDVIMHLDMFLKGVGYSYNGELCIGEPAKCSIADVGLKSCEHTEAYYDVNRNR